VVYKDPQLLSARNRLTALRRFRVADDPAIAEARGELGFRLLAATYRDVAQRYPEITDEHRAQLVALIEQPDNVHAIRREDRFAPPPGDCA
jgi:hypothetical protein